MAYTHRIAAPKVSPHCGHRCSIVPLKVPVGGKTIMAHRGKSIVDCECGVRVVLPTRNLRKEQP